MSEQDDRLQEYLDQLAGGASQDELISRLAEDETELASLITLAAALQEMPHPHLSPEAARVQKAQIMAAAVAGGMATPSRFERLRNWVLPRQASLAAGFVATLVALLFGGVWLRTALQAQVVGLREASGQVQFAQADRAGDWLPVHAGATLRSGQHVRTGPASSATLVFHEGSTAVLGPDTELTLTRVGGGWGGSLRVVLEQTGGAVAYRVVPLRGQGSSFQIDTPSGAARVHGTSFRVAVDRSGPAHFAVDSGRVAVSTDLQEVFLDAGQVATALPDGTLTPPAFQFVGQGQIDQISGTTWTISGVAVTVIDQTILVGDPQPGDPVRVAGRVLDDGIWLADSIERLDDADGTFHFTGILEAQDGSTWRVSGFSIQIDEDTLVDPELAPGDRVRVGFSVQADGSWLAFRVEALESSDDEPTPTPTATPDPDAQPSLSFEPEELLAQGCQTNFQFNAALVNLGEPPGDYAANVQLGFVILDGAEFVQSVVVEPSFWAVIPAGEQVNFDVTVTLNAAWSDVPDGTQVQVQLFVANETNLPGHHLTRLTLTMVASCGTPTITPTPTDTPTPTATPSPTPTATAEVSLGRKVTICHRPPGNPNNAHTISIGQSAVPAHLAHGDTLGPCP